MMLPAMKYVTMINSSEKGKSIRSAIVPDVKKFLITSNSLRLLANEPTTLGLLL